MRASRNSRPEPQLSRSKYCPTSPQLPKSARSLTLGKAEGYIVFSLKSKVAFVTGAASGIGAAIADVFAGAGAIVWVADRDEANGKTVTQRFGGKFIRVD